MAVKKFLILYHFYNFIIQKAICADWTKWTLYKETDVSFNTSVISEDSIPLMMCLIRCQGTKGCRAVQVNEASSKCELLSYYPPDNIMSATERIGWTIYSKAYRNKNFTISIHDSFDDAKDTGMSGTVCKTYTGEEIPSVKMISCEQLIYGKALRIRQTVSGIYLQFCEVKVFFG